MSTTSPAPSDDEILRVGAGSPVAKVAAAIAHAVYDRRIAHLRAVGAGAVNQTVKAIAIARGYAAPRGYDLVCVPSFENIESHDGTISAMKFTVTVA